MPSVGKLTSNQKTKATCAYVSSYALRRKKKDVASNVKGKKKALTADARARFVAACNVTKHQKPF
jgi:hypothetical protein